MEIRQIPIILMINNIIFIAIILAFTSCTMPLNNPSKLFDKGAKVHVKILSEDNVKSGYYLSYSYSDESLSCYEIYKYKKGIKHGDFIQVCKDSIGGDIGIEIGAYIKGKKDGEFKSYSDGRLSGIYTYDNGKKIKFTRIETSFR